MLRSIVLTLTAGATSLAFAVSARAETVGTCVWSKLSEPIKADYLAAFPDAADNRSVNRAMVRLSRYRGAVQVAGRGCTTINPPEVWVTRAVVAHAVMLGSAATLQRNAGVPRQRLDAVWRGASESARACVMAPLGKRLGLKMPACSDRKAFRALVATLGLSDREAGQAANYISASAESEIVEAMIARRQNGG